MPDSPALSIFQCIPDSAHESFGAGRSAETCSVNDTGAFFAGTKTIREIHPNGKGVNPQRFDSQTRDIPARFRLRRRGAHLSLRPGCDSLQPRRARRKSCSPAALPISCVPAPFVGRRCLPCPPSPRRRLCVAQPPAVAGLRAFPPPPRLLTPNKKRSLTSSFL
jgi:hypothetical protein